MPNRTLCVRLFLILTQTSNSHSFKTPHFRIKIENRRKIVAQAIFTTIHVFLALDVLPGPRNALFDPRPKSHIPKIPQDISNLSLSTAVKIEIPPDILGVSSRVAPPPPCDPDFFPDFSGYSVAQSGEISANLRARRSDSRPAAPV
jgi:hypothetical protein